MPSALGRQGNPLMLLTFQPQSILKIRKTLKWTTIRKNADRWYGWWVKRLGDPPALLQVYEGNPRNGGQFVAEIICGSVTICQGRLFDHWTATADGFDSLEALLETLGRLHSMSQDEVLEHDWAILSFDPVRFHNQVVETLMNSNREMMRIVADVSERSREIFDD